MRRKSEILEEAESAKRVNSKGASSSGDSVPRPSGIFRFYGQPSESSSPLGLGFLTEPQPGLGSGIGAQLASRRGLSSAPVAGSVSLTTMIGNAGTNKELDCRSAFRQGIIVDLDRWPCATLCFF